METEPNQRNETALRWSLVSMLDPEQRRVVLDRELEYVTAAARGDRRGLITPGPGALAAAPSARAGDGSPRAGRS